MKVVINLISHTIVDKEKLEIFKKKLNWVSKTVLSHFILDPLVPVMNRHHHSLHGQV